MLKLVVQDKANWALSRLEERDREMVRDAFLDLALEGVESPLNRARVKLLNMASPQRLYVLRVKLKWRVLFRIDGELLSIEDVVSADLLRRFRSV